MRSYSDCSSQQSRQYDATAALDAVTTAASRTARQLNVTLANHAEIAALLK